MTAMSKAKVRDDRDVISALAQVVCVRDVCMCVCKGFVYVCVHTMCVCV